MLKKMQLGKQNDFMKVLSLSVTVWFLFAGSAFANFYDDFSNPTESEQTWTPTSGSWATGQWGFGDGYLKVGTTNGFYQIGADFTATTENHLIAATVVVKHTNPSATDQDTFSFILFNTTANKGFRLMAQANKTWGSSGYYLKGINGVSETSLIGGTSGSLVANTWNTLRIELDPANNTLKAYEVTGVEETLVLSYSIPSIWQIDSVDRVGLSAGIGDGREWQMDSVSVVVPEPATMSLLLCGLAGIIVRKRINSSK